MTNIEQIESALSHIDSDDRDTWVQVGMAIQSELGDFGFCLWDSWSQRAESYNSRDAESTWKSFTPSGGVNVGSLFHLAKQYGWVWSGTALPQEEIAKQRAKLEARNKLAAKQKTEKQQRAANVALALWQAGGNKPSKYFEHKQVKQVETVRTISADDVEKTIGYRPKTSHKKHIDNPYLEGQLTLAPVLVDGKISTIEMIDAEGRKSAIKDGKKSGGYWAAQKRPEDDSPEHTFLIGEGIATVLSCRQATGFFAIATLSSHNLQSVSGQFRELYPESKIIVVSDRGNGEKDAEKAAQAIGGMLAVPEFSRDASGSDFNDLAVGAGIEEVRRQIEAATKPTALAELATLAAPKEPLPLRRPLPKSEPFPLDVLPPVLRGMADKIIETIQPPAALAGQSILAAASLAVQSLGDISIDGRTHPLSSFFITIGESGERKSATDNSVLAPHRKHERALVEKEKNAYLDYQASLDEWKKAREAATKGKENIKHSLMALGAEPEPPLDGQIITEEPTYEGIFKLLQYGQPSIGIFSAEGGRFIGGHAMGKDNQLKTATGLSSLWDGSPMTRTRSGDGSKTLYGRRCSLHLMLQPNIASDLFSNQLLIGQGLLSRCLATYPESTIGSRFYQESDINETSEGKAYFIAMANLLEWKQPLAEGKRNELEPTELYLELDAKREWINFHNHIEGLMLEGCELSSIRGFAAKAAEHATRLAGIIALVNDPATKNIPLGTIQAGIELSQFYIGEALRLFHSSNDDQDLILAENCLEWAINQGGLFSLPCLYQRGPSRVRSQKTAKHIVEVLMQHNRIEEIDGGAVIEGTKRRNVWRVAA